MSKKDNYKDINAEIDILIAYGVEEHEQQEAMKFVDTMRANGVALLVLKDFYSTLPGTVEEPVIQIVLLESRQGVYLLGVVTPRNRYLYFGSNEKAGCLGPFEDGITDNEILLYFDVASNKEFQKKYSNFDEFKDFGSAVAKSVTCPVCSVEEGEMHILGCAVEVCPWCDGQLNKCSCRFEKLDLEAFEREEDLVAFENLLETKGRIRFTREQAPAYPKDRTVGSDA